MIVLLRPQNGAVARLDDLNAYAQPLAFFPHRSCHQNVDTQSSGNFLQVLFCILALKRYKAANDPEAGPLSQGMDDFLRYSLREELMLGPSGQAGQRQDSHRARNSL